MVQAVMRRVLHGVADRLPSAYNEPGGCAVGDVYTGGNNLGRTTGVSAMSTLGVSFLALLLAGAPDGQSGKYFKITVVD